VATVAILPVKRFDAAKTRLLPALGAATCASLAEAMLADVLAALAGTRAVDRIVVVTAEPRAVALADAHGGLVVPDGAQAGQSAAVELGLQAARGAGRAVLVPGDCPGLDPAELELLLDRSAGRDAAVVVVPDRHGTGTNALVLEPSDAIAAAFGPGSRERHEHAAAAAGARCLVLDVPSLGLDIDTPEDHDALRAALPAHEGGARRTRELLARLATAAAAAAAADPGLAASA
jgi:2-phospho-L-lactate guanylyltransferase